MTTLFNTLIADESGFIVSAELVLIATIAVLGVIVGLVGIWLLQGAIWVRESPQIS